MNTRFLVVVTLLVVFSILLTGCGTPASTSQEQSGNVLTAIQSMTTMPTGPWYVARINENCNLNVRATYVYDSSSTLVEFNNGVDTAIVDVTNGSSFVASCYPGAIQLETFVLNNQTFISKLYSGENQFELVQKNGDPVVVSEGKNLGTIELIPFDMPIDLVLPNEDPAEFGELYQIEAEIYAYWEGKVSAEPLKKNEFEQLLADGISVGIAQISVVNGEMNIYVDPMFSSADVLIPAITYTAEQTRYLLAGMSEFIGKGNGLWYKTFHYAMEQTKLGGSPYDLWGASTLMFRVFKTALESNSFYSLGTKVLATAKVGGYNIGIVLDQSGAAVTTILTDYRHGKFNNGEAERYLNAKIAQGWTQINRDQLPAGIQKYWRDAAKPPVIRIAAWAVLYQAKMAAIYLKIAVTASLSQLLAFLGGSYTDFVLLAVPPCTDAITSICPFAEAPGT